MITFLSILLFGPLVIMILFEILKSPVKVVRETVDDMFGPLEGKYEIQKLDFQNCITEMKVLKILLTAKDSWRERYLRIYHLEKSNNSYTLDNYVKTDIEIPNTIELEIKNELRNNYTYDKVGQDKLMFFLKFILENYDIISYKIKPKEHNRLYTLINKNKRKVSLDNDFFLNIDKIVEQNYRVIFYYWLCYNSYKDTYKKMVYDFDWNFEKFKLNYDFIYDPSSKKWDYASDRLSEMN